MTEWLKVADCKSVGCFLHRFESYLLQHIMPQFDKITFFNQIFWLTLSFLSFYFIILKGLLPVLASSLKTRKKLVNYVFSASNSSETSSKKSYYKNLQQFLKTHKSLFSLSAQKKLSISEASKTKVLTQTFFSS